MKNSKLYPLLAMGQAVQLAACLAQFGTCDQSLLEKQLQTLLVFDTSTAETLYGSLNGLSLGGAYIYALAKQPLKIAQLPSFQLTRSFLSLAKKILFSKKYQSQLKTQLVRIQEQTKYFGSILAPRVVENLASLYVDLAEDTGLRLKIGGKKEFLQDPHILSQIRAVLFSGVRAAVMWYQLRGNMLNFLFERQMILQEVHPLGRVYNSLGRDRKH